MLIGKSLAMAEVAGLIGKFAARQVPVLITGESGTGKELVAQAIHMQSPRAAKPFVVVDCAALSPGLMESELFGYVRGAFTGAWQNQQGLLEAASCGTVFLDEIGELSIAAQGRLLRVLQEKTIRPLGTVRSVPVDIRFVAATHHNLESAMEKGLFREDLYHRLNVLRIGLPPLRERRQDIPELAQHFAGELSQGGSQLRMSGSTVERLMKYSWPGNVRELKNRLEIAVALEIEPTIPACSSSLFSDFAEESTEDPPSSVIPLAELERRAIVHALAVAKGDCALAASLLKVGKSTIYRKFQEYKGKKPLGRMERREAAACSTLL